MKPQRLTAWSAWNGTAELHFIILDGSHLEISAEKIPLCLYYPLLSHICLLWRGDFEGVKFPSKGERPRNRTLQSAGHLPLSWWSWCFEIYASSSPQVGNNFLLYRKAAALWRDVKIHFDCQTSEGRTALFQAGNTFVKCSCAWSRAIGAIVDFLLSAVKPHGYLRANTIP